MKRLLIRTALLAIFATGASDSAQADLTISKKPTHDLSCAGGVCTATAKRANLNVTDLTNLLAAGDATVKFGGGALAIQVLDGFSWTSTRRLTLDANTSVEFHKPVTVAGQGALTITYNDGGSVGDLVFFGNAKVDFLDLKSKFTINGQSYTLANTLAGLGQSQFVAFAADYDAKQDGTYTAAPVARITGAVEGLGHKIVHLSLKAKDRQREAALFGENDGLVRNISVIGARVTNHYKYGDAATLAGYNQGAIDHCRAIGGSVSGAAIIGDGDAGGLAGVNLGTITASSSTAAVSGLDGAGGLVGTNGQSGLIAQSFAGGSVFTNGLFGTPGGFASTNLGKIADSYATGPVAVDSGSEPAGGFVGDGVQGGRGISTSYSLGAVSGQHVGGFAGFDSGPNKADYWDLDTSGVDQAAYNPPNDPGVTGLTDDELKAFLPAGFDRKIWGQSPSINNGYPYLLANPPQ